MAEMKEKVQNSMMCMFEDRNQSIGSVRFCGFV
jgi:hypothetical protein